MISQLLKEVVASLDLIEKVWLRAFPYNHIEDSVVQLVHDLNANMT